MSGRGRAHRTESPPDPRGDFCPRRHRPDRHRQHTINVYVFPAPLGAKDTPAQKLSRQGYHLLRWTRGGMDYWAISDLNAPDLDKLEELLATR